MTEYTKLPHEIAAARQAARDAGELTYMGRPCSRGHDGQRWTRGSGGCYHCNKAKIDARPRSTKPSTMRMKAEWKTARASAIENGDSTFMGRPCDRGHDGRRYLSGGCYDCTIARTDERRPGPKKNCPQPIGKTTPAHRQARAEAQAEGHTSYHGRACSICKLTERYTGNNSCLKCARDKAIRAYHGNLARAMFHRAKTRSKIEGWYFNLEQSDIVVPTHCPILGIELFASAIRDHAPSLDRIDNSKGYVKGNIQVISQRANRLKSDATIAEWELIGAYMKRNLATTSVSLD